MWADVGRSVCLEMYEIAGHGVGMWSTVFVYILEPFVVDVSLVHC